MRPNAAPPRGYVGRFAPSPTGPLHAGSLVAALASWLDARAHSGQWLLRIEDVDTPRCIPGMDAIIVSQLAACGLHPDAKPLHQSQRAQPYQAALDTLIAQGQAYPCACTRRDIAQANAALGRVKPRHGELVYPGTCRPENGGLHGQAGRAWRLAVPDRVVSWSDRRLGAQSQDLAQAVGDFVLRRADGLWAYQLAVVVDDAAQGVTHIVRGEDLADNTPRQIWLQSALNAPLVCHLHTPLVMGEDGQKLSKQNGAQALDLSQPLRALQAAASVLGLEGLASQPVDSFLTEATAQWARRWGP